jgi:lactate dehydrogenase-like 2-hydroxyacid dehydrogenase
VSNDRPTILVPGKLHDHAVKRIGDAFRLEHIDRGDASLITPRLAQSVRGVAAMTTIDAAFIDALPELEIIAHFGVGYDAVDAKHAATRGVMVTNTPDVLTEEVADTAIGLLLNTLRELPQAEIWLRDGSWATKGMYPFTPLTLRGRSVGIFGMGRIGQAIARRLVGFGVPVSYHNRRKVEGVSYQWHSSLLDMARAVDTIISVAPGGATTDKIVGMEVFEALGPNGVFINIGRGSTVDEDALVEALNKGVIAAAGLDVFDSEPKVRPGILSAPNTSLLPHVGSASVATRQAMADLVVDNLVSWFRDGKAVTPVPETAKIKS